MARETEPEKTKSRKSKAKAPSVEDLQRQNQTLTALLTHFAPDVDPGAEKDRIAFYEDGTPVYVPPTADGEDEELEAEEDDENPADAIDEDDEELDDDDVPYEAEPVAKKARKSKITPIVPRVRKPAETRRNTARQKVDVRPMIAEARKVNAGL